MAKRKPKPVAVNRFDVDDTCATDVARAVSLALAVMDAAKVNRWADLDWTLPETVWLDDSQIELIEDNAAALELLRTTSSADGITATKFFCCPECGRWCVASSAVSSCAMTFECPGKPVAVKAAKKSAVPDNGGCEPVLDNHKGDPQRMSDAAIAANAETSAGRDDREDDDFAGEEDGYDPADDFGDD